MLKINHIRCLSNLLRAIPTGLDTLCIVACGVNVAAVAQRSANGGCTQFAQNCRRLHLGQTFQKYNKKSTNEDEDSDNDEDIADFKDERDSKVLKTKVNSLRADLLLRAGLGMARNKIETIFYESKIRVNGQKLGKKSVQLTVGDEIDVIRGFSQQNPSHLVISRVIILAASEREEGYGVSLRRYKSLLIDNYAGMNAYKSSEVVQH